MQTPTHEHNVARPGVTPRSVWIVDDDRSIRWVLEKALAREGIPYQTFTSAYEVQQALAVSEPQVLVSDIRMSGESGLSLLAKVKETHPNVPVIIMTAYSDLDSAVQAFQGGAFEYLPKPFDVDHALALIRRAASETPVAAAPVPGVPETPEMLGQAPAMQEVFRAIGRLSPSGATVLITGESGTGKELVARALHRHSPRAAGPFVAINTAAIPKDLLESELFGHDRGAFTGAQTARRGRFEQAEGGTLFLDEIGDMPLALQVKLLRASEERAIRPVGTSETVPVDVRIVAATNRDLAHEVDCSRFRRDLYFRLNVFPIALPPLRSRTEDIVPLVLQFLASSPDATGLRQVAADARRLLETYPWPGNVRELENEVARIVTHAEGGGEITARMLSPQLRGVAPGLPRDVQSETLRDAVARFESWYLSRSLERNANRRLVTARELGITRECLYKKLRRYGLQ